MEPQQNPQPVASPASPPVEPPTPTAPPPDGSGGAPDNSRKPNIVYVGFILALFLPIAGLIISIIAWRKVSKQSLPGKGLTIAGTIIGGILSLISLALFGLALFLFATLGGFHGNGAEDASKPLTKQLEQIGGKKICSNGDSGYGIDNITPWYDVYYQMPDGPELTSKVKSIAVGQGYQLTMDQDLTNQLKGLPDKDGVTSEPYGGEQFNPKSDYLKGSNGGKDLSITINRQTDVALYCNSGQYGRKQATGNGAILSISLRLPDTQR